MGNKTNKRPAEHETAARILLLHLTLGIQTILPPLTFKNHFKES